MSLSLFTLQPVRRARRPVRLALRASILSKSARLFAPLRVLLTLCALLAWFVASKPVGATASEESRVYWSADTGAPITLSADAASRWREGAYDVWLLEGRFSLNQGQHSARAQRAVLWIDREGALEGQLTKVIAYLEGAVMIDAAKSDDARAAAYTSTQAVGPFSAQQKSSTSFRIEDSAWFGRFYTTRGLSLGTPPPTGKPQQQSPVYQRALARFRQQQQGPARPAQFTAIGAQYTASGPETINAAQTQGPARPAQYSAAEPQPQVIETFPPGTRRLLISPRTSAGWDASYTPSETGESIAVITSGIVLRVDGLANVGALELAADRAVIWTQGDLPALSAETVQPENLPLEVYLEGNIEFRQGDRIIRADRMYYDVRNRVGMVLNADMQSPVPNYRGMVRLKAAVLRQLDESRFVAHQGLVTTSRLGFPRYDFQSGLIAFEDVQTPQFDPRTGSAELDENLDPIVHHQYLASSQSNTVHINGAPILYWPTMATDLEKPTFYINDFDVGKDDIFGNQIRLGLDAYQVLGIRDAPPDTDWDFNLDYLDRRGFGYGTTYDYKLDSLFGLGGPLEPSLFQQSAPVSGYFDAWGIDDHGLDNLGLGRRAIMPEKDYRGRVLWRHRHELPRGFTFTAEAGLISDFNFLEEYYEQEWDEWKDQTTGVELKQTFDNQSWSVTSDVRLNNFFTQTEWLPRADHFWIGQPLLGDRLTWFEHTSVGYARMRAAAAPLDPTDAAMWKPLPYEANVDGERFATRQELDLPFELGPVKLVPYALGEFAHWGQDLTGTDLQRLYYQTGVRASVPFWCVDPAVRSDLWNLNGLAHKISLNAELSFAEGDQDVTRLPLYDAIDDDSIEAFRRAFAVNLFGLPTGPPPGAVPAKFDPRFYLNRTNIGGWVSSPTTEVVEDLTALRLGARQRWQTKRGGLGTEHIVDWITLDTNITWFPKENRDNFGQDFGLADYDFRWYLGDRVSIVSDGLFDFFGDGLRTMSIGTFLNRPERGNLYAGYRSIAGPVSSDILSFSYAYRMTEKWVLTAGMTADLSNNGSVSQSFSITRVGESFLVTLGAAADRSKDNVSVSLLIEPRFLPSSSLSRRHHLDVGPSGEYGLE